MHFSDEILATADPPSEGVHNPIHDEEGADAAGYAGALVAGVRTYGWAVRTITRALGGAWLTSGWVDYSLKRPLFAKETMTIKVTETNNDAWTVTCTAGDDCRVVLEGTAGFGPAPWLQELNPPAAAPPAEPVPPLPSYQLATVPLNKPLHPLGAWLTSETAASMVCDDLATNDPHYVQTAQAPVPIHPYFLAGRMAPLTRHNFTYGPTIHVRSQIQHKREGYSDRQIIVGASIVDAYERNGHWYQILDGLVTDAEGELARIRHHTIFRPRGT